MSSTTTNLGLTKPANSDYVDVAVINSNYDIIDQFAGGVPDDISDLSDVTISTPTNGQVLKYDSSSSKWVNANEEGGVSDLDDLSDVTISNPSSGQILKYNSVSAKWENGNEVVPTTVIANPSATASETLGKLQVGSTVYSVPSGSSGGDSVSWNQTQVSGTKIAEITISGATTNVYSPTPTEVVANPSGTATTDLTSIQVGSTIYSLPQSGGSWVVGDTYYTFTYVMSNLGELTATEYLVEGGTTTQVQTGSISYASIVGGGARYVEFDDIEIRFDTNTYYVNALVDKVEYDGVQYGQGDSVISIPYNSATAYTNERIDKLVQGSSEVQVLTDLQDVTVSSVSNGQVLKYNSTSQKWENANESGGVSDLDDLTDVTISNPSNAQVLAYDSTSSKWVNSTLPSTDLDDLTDVALTTPSNGQVLKFNSSTNKWENANESGGGGGASALTDLTDVAISSATNGQALIYDNATSKWVNGTQSVSGLSDTTITTPTNGQVLTYDSTSSKWVNGAGGGGTTVVANPSGTATDELDTVQIGNTIYEIPSGGGGGGSWKDVTGTLTAGQTQITLGDASITQNSTIDVYTGTFGINPIDIQYVAGTEISPQPFVTQESELIGTISTSGDYDSITYPEWKAFCETGGWVAANTDVDHWFAYEFPNAEKIVKIQWICDDSSRRSIVSKIQYSNDGTNWNDCTLSTNESGNVVISSVNTATHWRLYFDAPFGPWQQPMIRSLNFISQVNSVCLTFTPLSENLGVKVRVS